VWLARRGFGAEEDAARMDAPREATEVQDLHRCDVELH